MKIKDVVLLIIPFFGFLLGALVINMFGNLFQTITGTIGIMFTWIIIVYACVLLIVFRKLEGKFFLQLLTGFGIPFIVMVVINLV